MKTVICSLQFLQSCRNFPFSVLETAKLQRLQAATRDQTLQFRGDDSSLFSLDLADNDSTSSMEEVEMPGKLSENVRAMTAIATQIALENVSVTHYALRVISRMLDSVKEEEEHDDLVDKVCKKLINRPNSTYSKLWLQNMTYQQDVRRKKCPYDSRLCRLVMGEDVELWNLSWLKPEYAKDFPQSTIIDKEALAKVSHVITFRETRSYWDWLESLDREGLTSLATI